MLTEDYASNSASTVHCSALPLRNTEPRDGTLPYFSQADKPRNPNQTPCCVYETSRSRSDQRNFVHMAKVIFICAQHL